MIFISCQQAALLSNKKEYHEASMMERVKLRLHLGMCRLCTRFARKNQQLTMLLQQARLGGLSDREKERMKRALQNRQ